MFTNSLICEEPGVIIDKNNGGINWKKCYKVGTTVTEECTPVSEDKHL